MHHEKIYFSGKENVYLECFVLDSGIRLGQETKRPAVIVCPGGGYVYLSPREGEPVAAAYAAQGFHAFVLHYSIRHAAAGYAPQKELDRAIALLREKADEWQIAADKIFTCGFSAGGHLAMSQALFGANRPDGVILGYPAVSMKAKEAGFMMQLLSGKQTPEEEDLKYMDLPACVTPDAPPLFVFTTAEDTLTCRASLELAEAYTNLGLPCELHIFQKGPHGYALANEATADGAVSNLNPQAAQWLNLSAKWLLDVTGGLEFADISTSHIMDAIREMGLLPQEAAEEARPEEKKQPHSYIIVAQKHNGFDSAFIDSITAAGPLPDTDNAITDLLIDYAEEDGCGELDWEATGGRFGKGGIRGELEILDLKTLLTYDLCDDADLSSLGITFEKLEEIFRTACESSGLAAGVEESGAFSLSCPEYEDGRSFRNLHDTNPITYADLIKDLAAIDAENEEKAAGYRRQLKQFLETFTDMVNKMRRLC